MKSYLCLIIACTPLFYIAAMEVKMAGGSLVGSISSDRRERSAETQLKLVKAAVRKFSKVDGELLSGALGLTELSAEPTAVGRGPEATLAEGYATVGKAQSAVKRFVEAFEKREVPIASELEGAVNAPELGKLLADRKRLSEEPERKIRDYLRNGEIGASGPLVEAAKAYARLPFCDTSLVVRTIEANGKNPCDDPSLARKGSVLVLVLKTRDLTNDPTTCSQIDSMIAGLTTEQRDKLVYGRFVMLTNADQPPPGLPGPDRKDMRKVPWPGAGFVTDSADTFRRDDLANMFTKALEVAADVDQARGGNRIGQVQIIFRGESAPARGPGTSGGGSLPGLSRFNINTVSTYWIAPGETSDPGLLKNWFAKKFTIHGKATNFSPELVTELFYKD